MVSANQPPTRHFRIGVVHTSITSTVPGLLRQYSELYAHAERPEPEQRRIEVEVLRRPFRVLHRRRHEVRVNGRLRFEPGGVDQLLPYVEWGINWEVPRVWPEYLQLHAASLEFRGQGVILPGPSGRGKSTLSLGFLARGWRYLSDEFALIHVDTTHVHPYPRAICIKEGAIPVVKSLGLDGLDRRPRHLKGSKGRVRFIDPAAIRSDAVGRAGPVGFIIFPRFEPGASPRLERIHRAEAALALHEVCFNLLDCQVNGLDVIARLVRNAECLRLVSGELVPTCDLVESYLLDHGLESVEGGTVCSTPDQR